MILVECINESNNQYLLVYAKSLYIALCLSIINTNKIIVAGLMLLMLFNIPLLNLISLVLCLTIFIFKFIQNPYLFIYLSYLGSCLFILAINNCLMYFKP